MLPNLSDSPGTEWTRARMPGSRRKVERLCEVAPLDRTTVDGGLSIAAAARQFQRNADEAMELIRTPIEAVVLVPNTNELRAEIRDQLAAILALSAHGKRPRATGTPLSQGAAQHKLRWLRG